MMMFRGIYRSLHLKYTRAIFNCVIGFLWSSLAIDIEEPIYTECKYICYLLMVYRCVVRPLSCVFIIIDKGHADEIETHFIIRIYIIWKPEVSISIFDRENELSIPTYIGLST